MSWILLSVGIKWLLDNCVMRMDDMKQLSDAVDEGIKKYSKTPTWDL